MTILVSEEEIWQYLEALCAEATTPTCDLDQMSQVRQGIEVPAPTYDEASAFHSKAEMIEYANSLREAVPPKGN